MDEPIFTLRARDAGAADALATYIQLAADRGAEAAHIQELRSLHAAFVAFPVSVTPGREPIGSPAGSSTEVAESVSAPEA